MGNCQDQIPDFPAKEVLLLTFIKVLFFPECPENNFGDSLVALNYPDLDNRINSRTPEDGFDRYKGDSEMDAEDIFEEVMAKYRHARKPAGNTGNGYGEQDLHPLMKCARLNPIVGRIHPSPQKTPKVKLWLSGCTGCKKQVRGCSTCYGIKKSCPT